MRPNFLIFSSKGKKRKQRNEVQRKGEKGRKEIKCKIELSLIEYAVNLVWSFFGFDIFCFFLLVCCSSHVCSEYLKLRLVLYTSKLSKCDVNDFVQFTFLEFLWFWRHNWNEKATYSKEHCIKLVGSEANHLVERSSATFTWYLLAFRN